MHTKRIHWVGSSLEDIKHFPNDAKQGAGYQLDKVQRGLEPSDWKPMTSIGKGVKEIRVRGADGQYRVIYLAKLKDAVYVLHAFQKKTQKTSSKDLNIAKQRLKDLQHDH